MDAARGLALIGMITIHILPVHDPETFEPTLQWTLFGGRAAALFALPAGLGLAFSSGGRAPHRGRALTATRAGLVVRALLIASVGLAVNQVMPSPAPADPGATLAQVLLTGTYPAVPYPTSLCAGLLPGRTDLHELVVRVRITVVGVVLALGAWFVHWVLVLQAGGNDQLLRHTPGLGEDQIDEILVWGPSPDLPTPT